MSIFRFDRKRFTINEGGHYFTLFCGWTPPRMFRVWVGLRGRSYELCLGFGRIKFKRGKLCNG